MGDEKRTSGWWWVKALLWVCVLGGAAGAAWWSLSERAHPWEVVFRFRGESRIKGPQVEAVAISPDRKWLATGQSSGVVNIRNLETFALHAVLGDPNHHRDDDFPPRDVRWFADSQRVRFNDGRPRTFTLDGNEISIPRINDKPVSVFRPNPRNDTALVSVDWDFFLMDLKTGNATPVPEDVLGYDQYEDRGTYEWASDGRRMLLQTRDYVRLRNMQDGNDLWAHYRLNLRLPPPHIMSGPAAKPEYPREAPHDANHPWYTVCDPLQAAFILDEKYVAAIYKPYAAGSQFLYEDPDRHGFRLRLYDANTGKLAWDHVMSDWAEMTISPDGRRLYLLLREPGVYGGIHQFEAWDLQTRQRIYERDFSPYEDGFGPLWVESFPDGRWVALYGGYTWLVDTQRELPDIPLRVDYGTVVMFTAADGQRIIQMGHEGQMTIWQKRRDVHPLGVWALPETYALRPLLIGLMVGLVVIAGRASSRQFGRSLPIPLWVACLTIAIGVGATLAGELLSYITDPLTQMDYKPAGWATLAVPWGLSLFLAAALMGTMRLRRGWWKGLIAFQILAAAICVLAGVAVWQSEIPQLPLPVWTILLLSIGAACLFGLELVLLLWPSTREAIRSRGGVPFMERVQAARTRMNSLLGYDPAWSPEREETG